MRPKRPGEREVSAMWARSPYDIYFKLFNWFGKSRINPATAVYIKPGVAPWVYNFYDPVGKK